ncbi:MAG: DUF1801 domain-containing protein [Thermoanaerobaculia bacterium]|jgi:hypothetical protein
MPNVSRRKPVERKEGSSVKKDASQEGKSPSQLIDQRIAELGDWRGEMLARLRAVIRQADPDVVEEWKWNVPVWSHDGLICTGETYKKVVKLTFAKGAALDDPKGLFNSSLEGNTRRAIDFPEGATVDEKALKALIRAAVTLNASRPPGPSSGKAKAGK